MDLEKARHRYNELTWGEGDLKMKAAVVFIRDLEFALAAARESVKGYQIIEKGLSQVNAESLARVQKAEEERDEALKALNIMEAIRDMVCGERNEAERERDELRKAVVYCGSEEMLKEFLDTYREKVAAQREEPK